VSVAQARAMTVLRNGLMSPSLVRPAKVIHLLVSIVSLFELNRIYRPLDSWLKRKQVSNLCHCISQGSVASASFNGHLRQHRIVLVDIVVNYDLSFSRVDSTRSPCILCEGAAPRYQRREK